MPFIKWKDEFSVGITKIDDQHKQLVLILDELYSAMSVGKSKEAMGHILDELIQYTKLHFHFEESLMKNHHYPGLDEHLLEHHNLTSKVIEFQGQFVSGEARISMSVLSFLKDWLFHHINETDKKYAPFLNSKGIK